MKFDDDDQQAAYAKGFVDGRAQLVKQVKEKLDGAMREIMREKEKWTDVLTDPEKIIALAQNDPRFSEAMTTAVVALLYAEHEIEKAWEATDDPAG